jgi:hypothetical protein
MKRFVMIAAALLAACGSSSSGVDAPSIDRGPTNTPLEADPNGLYWDAGAKMLYVADQDGNQLLTWTDAAGFGTPIPLTSAAAGDIELGGLAQLSDGTLLAPRFGFGTTGTIIKIKDGVANDLTGLDPMRRRLGITVGSDDSIFVTYFVKTTTSTGAIAKVTLDGNGGASEADWITPLVHPVGVTIVGADLFAGDQTPGLVYEQPVAAAGSGTVFTDADGPDLMSPGPGSSFFSGSTAGDVYQFMPDGTVVNFQTGFTETRGMAYDAANQRLFVAEHTGSDVNALHIFPVTP